MDSYGNGRQIIGCLWIPMEMVGKSLDSYGFPRAMVGKSMDSYGFLWKWYANHWISKDSYGNGRQTIGFLWIPMEMVGKSLDSYGFPWKW